MSVGKLSKNVAIQPREFETEDFIEKIEPFIDSLPQIFWDLIHRYEDTKYDESTRREETRAKPRR